MFLDRDTAQLWFSPSDVTTYLASTWLFAQRLAVARGQRDPWSDPEETTLEIARRLGDEHERRYLENLKTAGKNIAEIPRAVSQDVWTTAHRTTQEALADPTVDVIYQAHFIHSDCWRGQADFLERNDDGLFEPVDTKLARSVKPYMILQLCSYADAMAEITGALPPQFHVELGDGRRESFRTLDYIHYTRRTLASLVEFADGDGLAHAYPWPSPTLEDSGLQDEAEAIWERDDHLVLVANITRKQIERLAGVGITTFTALAQAGPDDKPQGMAMATFEKLRRQARLQKADPATWELLDPEPNRGLALLPRPSRGDIFYDIEGDPLWDSTGSLEYLHGLWWIDSETKEEVFRPLWAHDRDQEKSAFEDLIDLFVERRTAHPSMHIFHYAAYEVTALKRLARTYGTREEELDDLLRDEVFVDLFQVVRQSLQASVPNYSIKSLERFYMDEREAGVKEGGASIVQYEIYREITGTPEGQAILDDIEQYNGEDCKSTYLLREWLRARKREAVDELGWVIDEPMPIKPSEDFKNQSPTSGQLSPGEQHRMAMIAEREELIAAAANEPSDVRANGMLLSAELLLFNQREAKSQWWSYFAHCEMSGGELIDDSEALGGLEVVGGSGNVRTFSFPPQDFKIREKDQLKDPERRWHVGTVEQLDAGAREITIKLSGNAAQQFPRSVFEFAHFGADKIDDALRDLAVSLRRPPDQAADFAAAEKLLMGELPLYGEAIAGVTLPELREQLVDLEYSYLVAQGPPGTGKTYTAADLIVDQLVRGKRVGVTAGTHTAINNLLKGVEDAAIERGHSLSGVKKCTTRDQQFEGKTGMIASVYDNDEAGPDCGCDLIGGTAWLFSRAEWRGELDLIVIDEAGQFSLAYALAVATAAKTILMVGDPNQLPMVTKGAHPLGAGASALEHVISGHRTIPPELGVFLPESRRLYPDLCDFVSDAFYEGRLRPHECTSEFTPPFGQALNFVPVEHQGNRQSSVEEADAAVELVRRFEETGLEVMVVSPYNMQADLIRSKVDQTVPVLTVDKCQGQEADVVIYSMATSGGEEAPRGFEFLFSDNRFNVAISRARRAAYLVCSPSLLETEAKSVEDMRLANAFLAFVDRALAPGRAPAT